MIRLRSFLGGEWRDGEGEGAVLEDPATEASVATTSTKGLDLAGALRFAREEGGPTLRAMTLAERGKLLDAMTSALQAKREALIDASIANAGTTRSDAKFDVDGAIGTLSYYAKLGLSLGDRRVRVEGEGEQITRSKRFWGHHVCVPRHGAAVHINAFNFPAWGLAEKAAVALLAGVPVVTKPATSTALTAYVLVETLVDAGVLPKGSLQLVCGGAGDLLDHLGPQDCLAFTGSGDTGAWMRALAPVTQRSVRVNVEADSLNAVVLGPDVRPGSDTWQAFVRDAVREITQKTGQKCTATRRIFVPREQIDAALEAIAEGLSVISFGLPSRDDVRMGPLASAQQLRDVQEGITRLEAAGAKVAFRKDGAPVGVPVGKGYFVPPTLLRLDDPHVGVVHEHEVFGPVSTVMPYGTVDEAVALVAKGEGGLVASVYTDDRDALERLLLGLAPWSGRVLVSSEKVADQAISPGLVLPSCVHGGPGRAGGGEELGGVRGLAFYEQRTAVQGDRALLDRVLG
ncbi:MAG: 3,4-dehydroadipyl-CoA semialdehyde dehydrogenase [Myxococcales bacterium]|nr:3,4-dehydroadipyl-CoA semialdehyde dehydrogenase [Myxococcales bacterium]